MPYIQKTYIAGKTIEIEKTYSKRYGKKIQRGENRNPTPEAVKKQNAKLAEDKLRRLLNHNFSYKDIHLVLTYKREQRPDPAEAKQQLSKFLRKLRNEYSKRDMELKYIAVTEYKNKAIHHHLIVNRIDTGVFSDLWEYGRPHTTLLDNSGDYKQLASYFVKETNKTFSEKNSPFKKRWTASKNLNQVVPVVEVVKAKQWREQPSAKNGYILETDSIKNGVSEVTGFEYQFYRLIKVDKQVHKADVRNTSGIAMKNSSERSVLL